MEGLKPSDSRLMGSFMMLVFVLFGGVYGLRCAGLGAGGVKCELKVRRGGSG